MKMNLGNFLALVLLVVAVATVECSLRQRSIFRERLPEPCFTSRSEDRPFAYPLISFFNSIKNMMMKGVNYLKDNQNLKFLREDSFMDKIKSAFSK